MKKILIGGQALRKLGSDRYTDDIDYLIENYDNASAFIHTKYGDFLNAASDSFAGRFFNEIYQLEKNNEIASAQSLLELKAFAFVQHCQNFNFKKADSCEYDMKFLVREFNLTELKIANKYLAKGEIFEIEKIIKNVKK